MSRKFALQITGGMSATSDKATLMQFDQDRGNAPQGCAGSEHGAEDLKRIFAPPPV
ncbi:hypothetical protein [Amycolatopsis japonica]